MATQVYSWKEGDVEDNEINLLPIFSPIISKKNKIDPNPSWKCSGGIQYTAYGAQITPYLIFYLFLFLVWLG